MEPTSYGVRLVSGQMVGPMARVTAEHVLETYPDGQLMRRAWNGDWEEW